MRIADKPESRPIGFSSDSAVFFRIAKIFARRRMSGLIKLLRNRAIFKKTEMRQNFC